MLGNAGKHGEADGPEEAKARCGSLFAGPVVADLDSARARGKGAGALCSACVLLIAAERWIQEYLLFSFDFRI